MCTCTCGFETLCKVKQEKIEGFMERSIVLDMCGHPDKHVKTHPIFCILCTTAHPHVATACPYGTTAKRRRMAVSLLALQVCYGFAFLSKADISFLGCTPLHFAAANGHLPIVTLLLNRGAALTLVTSTVYGQKMLPPTMAIMPLLIYFVGRVISVNPMLHHRINQLCHLAPASSKYSARSATL